MPKRSTIPKTPASSPADKPRTPIPPKDLSPEQRIKVYELLDSEYDRVCALEKLRQSLRAAASAQEWSALLRQVAEDPQLPQPKPSRVGFVTTLEWPQVKVELDIQGQIVVLDSRGNTFARVMTASEAMEEIRLAVLKQ